MVKERSLKEEVKATMAEFAAAFEKGQVERLASMLAPETRLYLTDAKGTEEVIGATAASSKLGEYKEHRGSRLAFKNALVLQEGHSAYFDAQLEGHQAAKYGAAASAKLTAELERHGEQWQVKQMHYRAR